MGLTKEGEPFTLPGSAGAEGMTKKSYTQTENFH